MNTKTLQRIFATALLATSFAAVLPAQAQNQQNDEALAASVKSALLQDAPFKDADVDLAVTASNGHVDVSGWVTYADDPQRAAQIAASVNGVRQVSTHLRTWSSASDFRL